jgi:hypothetical protein
VPDPAAGGERFRALVPDMLSRPVEQERCPVCATSLVEHYAVVELRGAPYRIERVLGRTCANPDCPWSQECD